MNACTARERELHPIGSQRADIAKLAGFSDFRLHHKLQGEIRETDSLDERLSNLGNILAFISYLSEQGFAQQNDKPNKFAN